MTREEEFHRRQLPVSGWGPRGAARLKAASVLVAGAGGLGSSALIHLAGAGVGRITVADPDTVELSNLPRQILYLSSDLGRPKADAAEEALRKRNPWIRVEALPERVNEKNAPALAASHDLVLDCTDNFPSRFLIHDACREAGRALVSAGIGEWEAQIRIFAFDAGAPGCLRCLLPQVPEETRDSGEAGVAGALAGAAGSLQALAAVQYLLGLPGLPHHRILFLDCRSWRPRLLGWSPRRDCPCHDRPPGAGTR